MTDMNKFYEACCCFNEVAGNDKKLTLKDFKNQQEYNMEECKEIQDGIDANDAKEIFDGVLDNFVTNFGHLQRLAALGFDVEKGMAAIALNNLSKYIADADVDLVNATIKHHSDKGISCYPEWNKKHRLYAVKRTDNNKILKPLNFISVELGQFIPADILKNGLEI